MVTLPEPQLTLAMLAQRLPGRDRQALEGRRKQAAQLFARDIPQAVVARALKVSRRSVSRCYRPGKKAGLNA
jgi:DNA-binding transcriptional regulator LsrR (DeoR family)